jgi:hypothetical protein
MKEQHVELAALSSCNHVIQPVTRRCRAANRVIGELKRRIDLKSQLSGRLAAGPLLVTD